MPRFEIRILAKKFCVTEVTVFAQKSGQMPRFEKKSGRVKPLVKRYFVTEVTLLPTFFTTYKKNYFGV